MTTFAVIILVIILITLSILWWYISMTLFHDSTSNENVGVFSAMSAIYLVVAFFIVKYIIIWGYPLFVTQL